MNTAQIVKDALAVEQERLSALPCRHPGVYFEEFFGGRLVLGPCPYSGSDPEMGKNWKGEEKAEDCRGCFLKAEGNLTEDGKWVTHAKALDERDQIREQIDLVGAVLGFEAYDDAPLYAHSAATSEAARHNGFEGKIGKALAHYAEVMARRDATAGSQKALKDLKEFKRDREREIPFFTESGLYDLIGKDDARSVLGLVNSLETAMGAG